MMLETILYASSRLGPLSIFFLFLLLEPNFLGIVESLKFGSALSKTHATEEKPTSPENWTLESFDFESNKRLISAGFDEADLENISNSRVKPKVLMTELTTIDTIPSSNIPMNTNLNSFTLVSTNQNRFKIYPSDEQSELKSKRNQNSKRASHSALGITEQSLITSSQGASPAAQFRMPRADRALEEQSQDGGFNLFFKTNPKEMMNVPITFSVPLPKWMNGTLVG